ncbi:LacI family DNA-binding transcriptional regulator [Ideonella sp.]|uniref:LacI family DNA-binding transcriptional regulator n=1 Tax=Ideonella sp. TaxID=1929293 RepID=UPI002B47213D|nr:LacI family DNA-binding transcriptional regulator [Ideonella sp.]HJV71937.1 LacI family DNA-binding transcriptional regulator [Ideonella sp.]
MSASTPKPSQPTNSRRHKLPTLADVAREAGVSDVAASCALNAGKGSTRVSAETRERVLAAAKRLRYLPNATARALSRQRANAIGFVANIAYEEPNLYFQELFNGVVRGATDAQQTTCIFPLSSWDEAPNRIPALCDGRVDGLVVLAPNLEDDSTTWLPLHTPLVTIHAGRQFQGQVNVEADDEAGGFGIVCHMFELGYRRILCVGGPPHNKSADRRVDGFLRAHAENAVEVASDHVIRTWFTVEDGRRVMEKWLQNHRGEPLPEAIFCGNDDIALGCIEALEARGLGVPRDISVAGFDDTLLARRLRMATVRQPLLEMGRHAVNVLMQLIEAQRSGEPYEGPRNIVLPVEIVPGRTLFDCPRNAPLMIP